MKITKRQIVFEKLDHTPPLRVVQQDWERDAEDDKGDRALQGIGIPASALALRPRSGFRLVIEVARDKDAMGELHWTELAIA